MFAKFDWKWLLTYLEKSDLLNHVLSGRRVTELTVELHGGKTVTIPVRKIRNFQIHVE